MKQQFNFLAIMVAMTIICLVTYQWHWKDDKRTRNSFGATLKTVGYSPGNKIEDGNKNDSKTNNQVDDIKNSKKPQIDNNDNNKVDNNNNVDDNNNKVNDNKNSKKLQIDTPGCAIPLLDPFDASVAKHFSYKPYGSCPAFEMPFQVRAPNRFKLKDSWRGSLANCFYTVVEGEKKEAAEGRKGKPSSIAFDPSKEVVVNASFVRVQCSKKTYFLSLPFRPLGLAASKATLKKTFSPPSKKPFDVYVIGVDSVSRSHSLRHLRQTRDFLLSNEINATEFVGYNKVGLNTLPNWAVMHTGWPMPKAVEKTKGEGKGKADDSEWAKKSRIWNEYSAKGFWTLFGDDWEYKDPWAFMDIKNVDYRYVTIHGAMAENFSEMKRFSTAACVQGRRYGDIEQEWFLNFLDAHRPFPEDSLFAWVWHADWCHDILNGAKMVDEPTVKMLKRMKKNGDLEKGVLIFLSDHGFRQGAFAKTSYGEMDNNLPFLFVSFPSWFEKRYPGLVANVRRNSRLLVSAYDLHKTMQHFLHLQTEEDAWRNDFPDKDGLVPQESFSLMTEIPKNRTCKSTGIPDIFCACSPLKEVDLSSAKPGGDAQMAKDGAAAFIETINSAMRDVFDICFKWRFKKLITAKKIPRKSKFMVRVETLAYDDEKTHDDKCATFDGWVSKESTKAFTIKLEETSRVDRYGTTSSCVLERAYHLKKFCRCRN